MSVIVNTADSTVIGQLKKRKINKNASPFVIKLFFSFYRNNA